MNKIKKIKSVLLYFIIYQTKKNKFLKQFVNIRVYFYESLTIVSELSAKFTVTPVIFCN